MYDSASDGVPAAEIGSVGSAVQGAGEHQVGEFGLGELPAEDDVLRRDVLVDDLLLMRVIQGAGEVDAEPHHRCASRRGPAWALRPITAARLSPALTYSIATHR